MGFRYSKFFLHIRPAAKIKANGKFFNSIAAMNKYVETFTFGEDRLRVQIDTIENCKKKITIGSTAYARLAIKFLSDESWRESRWTEEQFTEVLEPLLVIKSTLTNQRDRHTGTPNYRKKLGVFGGREN